MVTLAPDTAVRCVKPATLKSSAALAVTAEVSPSTSAGSIAARSAGSTSRAVSANSARICPVSRRAAGTSPSVGSPMAVSTATLRSARSGRPMRARNPAGRPTDSPAKPVTGANTSTMPVSSAPSSSRSPARNMMRPRPIERGDSVGTTLTVAVSPCRAAIGWWRASWDRSAIDNPNAVPTTATAATPATPSPIPWRAHHRPASTVAARAPSTTTTRNPGGQTMPAAVTTQLVSAAGTSRISTWRSSGFTLTIHATTRSRSLSSRAGPIPSTSLSWSTLVK